ncbi:MAG TPA: PAS domain S-box protein, partial [Dehalococcoidia bacterium]|nr:PAS domain S-box protein [Dehalococcoidia bacterium]
MERGDHGPSASDELKRSLRAQRLLERYPLFCGWLAIVVGAVVLAGWWLGLAQLTSISPRLPPMVPNSALMAGLLGASLLLLAPAEASRPRTLAGKLFAGGAGLLSGLTLAELVLGLDLRIDQLLATTGPALAAHAPGRPAPQTAAAVLLTATALLIIDRRTERSWRPADLLALVSGLIPLAALLGYLFQVAALYGPLRLIPSTEMSIPTAVALLALSTGTLAARAQVGVLSVLTAEDSGGIAARQLLAWLLVLIPLVCAIALGPRLGLFTAPLASAGIVLLGVVAGGSFVLLISRRLSQLDAKRREGDESRFRLASLVDSTDDAIIAKTPEGIILDWNAAAERLYGYQAAEMIGRSIYQLVPPDRVKELEGILESVRRGERVRSLETA